MEKRDAVLKKCLSRRLSESFNELQNLNCSLKTILSELENILTNILSKLTSPHDSPTEASLLCDQEVDKLCGFEPKYTTMLSKLTQTLLTDHTTRSNASSPNQSLANDSLCSSDLNESHLSDSDDKFQTELNRLNSNACWTLMLETEQGMEEARLKAELDHMEKKRLQGPYSTNSKDSELHTPEFTDAQLQEIIKLKEDCDLISFELGHLEDTDWMRKKIEHRLAKRKQYLERMDMVVRRVTQKYIWLKFLSDILQIELNYCEKIDSTVKSLCTTSKDLIGRMELLLSRLIAADPSEADVVWNKLSQEEALENFTRTLIRVLTKIPLPPECATISHDSPSQNDSILTVLNILQTKLADDKKLVADSSTKLSRYAQRMQQHFQAIESIIRSDDPTSATVPLPHTDRLNPARIRYSSSGLCSPIIIEWLTDSCQDLNQFTDDLRALQHEADILFPNRC